MVSGNDESNDLKQAFKTVKIEHFIILAILVAGIYGVKYFSGHGQSGIDTTQYKTVALYFIKQSPTIAQKLGKVQSISHKGVGGDTGKESYNVFGIKGKDKSGVCHMTLKKQDDGSWIIKTAILSCDGAEYSLPVGLSRGGKFFKVFQ